MLKKIRTATYCLYLQAVIAIGNAIFGYLQYEKLMSNLQVDSIATVNFASSQGLSMFNLLNVLFILYSANELKQQTKWSWLMATGAFLTVCNGVGIFVSIAGMISLLDKEVREFFFKKMDIQF